MRKLFGKNRDAEIAGLDALNYAKLQDFHDFVDRRPGLQCGFNVASRSECIHVRVGRIERNAEKFDLFRREYTAGVDGCACGHELIGPDWSKRDEWVPEVVPLPDRFHLVDGRSFFSRLLQTLCSSEASGVQRCLARFLQDDRTSQGAGMNGQDGGHLEHQQNLVARGTLMKRSANVPPGTLRIQIGASSIYRNTNQLQELSG